MASAHPEYAIHLAAIGVLLAIGVPALGRGELLLGGVCVAVAIGVAVRTLILYLRARGT